MIEIKNLSKKYGNTFALQDVTLTLNPGEIVGLFGENGAGKGSRRAHRGQKS